MHPPTSSPPRLTRLTRRPRAYLAAALTALLAITITSSITLATAQASANPKVAIDEQRAHWLDERTIAWDLGAGWEYTWQLLVSPDGSISIDGNDISGNYEAIDLHYAGEMAPHLQARFPHLADYLTFTVDDSRDTDAIKRDLTGQLVAVEYRDRHEITVATGLQLPGVLDDLYAESAAEAGLGLTWSGNTPTLSVWAPTAKNVTLERHAQTNAAAARRGMDYDPSTGIWSIQGKPGWKGHFYRFGVEVWHPETQAIETFSVTDPHSVSLAADSTHSQIIDLASPDLKPSGWDNPNKPAAVELAESHIWEVHVRDFSAGDASIAEDLRGTYAAFSESGSQAVRHLQELSDAGLTHVHLLPTFDIGTIPERRSDWAQPDCDLASFAPDSPDQQACIDEVRESDSYNWGYDPHHFDTPEGSYATDPHGPQRILEYRQMVQALNDMGLRVVVDVVYNHTHRAGIHDKSVFDRIVPGYYHRLDETGNVTDSTCCPNTAPEHAMFGKFVVDSVELWADQYQIDGFRFDLMGHHPKQNMLDIRERLDAIGAHDVMLYGEGWNFGEVANNARFEQATQHNMAGTGIATFNDRMRDGVRGGGPFDANPRVQGFGSGQWTDFNGDPINGDADSQLAALRHNGDLTKLGLVGNLADYTFVTSNGHLTSGRDIDYGGSSAGYTADPGEAVNYVDAHDNEILFDALAHKLNRDIDGTDRARMQVLSLSTAVLSQGAGFVTAGSELLRSKSLDRDSYDSGDWFNQIRWDCADGNGFGNGLPPAWTSEHHWPYAAEILALETLIPTCEDIALTKGRYLELLEIATSAEAFSLGTGDAVQDRVSFPLSGLEETPGVITMVIDTVGLDSPGDAVVVVFNATPDQATETVSDLSGTSLALHPVLVNSVDERVRESSYEAESGTFTVPPRTVAVFQ
ncbi:pullulanase-type alpha-1,6-glucosidase [Natronoglycomyces albus]|uniref:Pullulanase-type alpha-1,6-glucosidase n=1 Tax=Natronoglycomyces albus TaxID=2811108 RepID=A0A895XTL1_9ACTN|nr:pullulanase-type alpha-1,6-glucosidase [Natronoglycomyces albus]QSB06639.1 pullulanase-type alpha-1,6-glucosidase [Natronoglycomyces albus]